jgi:hypothetical protein
MCKPRREGGACIPGAVAASACGSGETQNAVTLPLDVVYFRVIA